MQVPADLASRLSTVAASCGRSPELLLREAISGLIENTVQALPALEETPRHAGFVPQPQGFSIYE
jgi:predicted transcriptional regulator